MKYQLKKHIRFTEDLQLRGEIWKTPDNFSNYRISNLGRMRSLKTNDRLIMNNSNKYGYRIIKMRRDDTGKYQSHRVHRLVAELFIPNPDNKKQINHKNGHKTDNKVSNLEWCDQSENMRHSMLHSLHPTKLVPDDVREIRKLLKSGIKQKDIASMYDVSDVTITDIKNGTTWSYIK